MKKALLGTTALIAGGLMAGSVMAADLEPAPLPAPVDEGWEVVVGGFANTGMYYRDNNINTAADEVFVFWDAEIHFTASTTLANGIRIAVRVELEGGTTADQIDEHFMSIEGNFGRFEIGANDSATDGMKITAPGYGYSGVDGSSFTAGLGQDAPGGALDSLFGDANKVTYYTPRISGFQAGVSFAPNNSTNNGILGGQLRAGSVNKHIFSVAANYDNTFNDVRIRFGAGVERGKSASNGVLGAGIFTGERIGNSTTWNVGANVEMAGFAVGGNYSRTKLGSSKARVWLVAASYGTGPWTVGGGYLKSKTWNTTINNGTFQRVGGGAAYNLGSGVSLTADLQHEKRNNSGAGTGKAKGIIAGVGIKTKF